MIRRPALIWRGAGVAGARDLVHRLEHHAGARRTRDLGGAVGRVVVADDQLCVVEGGHRFADRGQRAGEQRLLVERRNDDRNLQPAFRGNCLTPSWSLAHGSDELHQPRSQ